MSVPQIHRQVYENLPTELQDFFYVHALWQGVSCIRLKSGVMKRFVNLAAENEQHSQLFLRAATTITQVANARNVWTCVRFSNDGYQSVLCYLGTRNIDEFLRLSAIRQAAAEQAEAEANYPDGILDENGEPYGSRT